MKRYENKSFVNDLGAWLSGQNNAILSLFGPRESAGDGCG